MKNLEVAEFKIPKHLRPHYNKAKSDDFKLLREPIFLDPSGEEFVYCYSFKRDREQFRYTWHLKYPFRWRRHLAKVGKASGDPQQEIRNQFPKRNQEEELNPRSVPEYPQIEMVIYVDNAYDCEQNFHNYIRVHQYLGGAGTEFFYTSGLELLRFCRIWVNNRNRAIKLASLGLAKSEKLISHEHQES